MTNPLIEAMNVIDRPVDHPSSLLKILCIRHSTGFDIEPKELMERLDSLKNNNKSVETIFNEVKPQDNDEEYLLI